MISFFCGRGGSAEIRGKQISKYLGAKLNPSEGYDNDVCVFVKIQPPENYPKNSYLDIVDGIERMRWLQTHPDIGVIASSICGFDYLRHILKRDVVYIPQHHCNYERLHRENRPIETVGVVGGQGAIMNDELKCKLDILHTKPKNRQEAVEAYKKLDIQVIWRLTANPLKNALKIVNAASFGIPTVAYPSKAYEEMDGYYYPVYTVKDMLEMVDKLKTGFNAQRLIDKAEEFHIDNIAKAYKEYLWN